MLKSPRLVINLPKSNLYCNPEIRITDKFNRNICKYGHEKDKNMLTLDSVKQPKILKLMKQTSKKNNG